MQTYKNFFTGILALTVFAAVGASAIAQDKLKPEEILAKHLASIGATDSSSKAKSLVATGDAKAFTHSSAIRDVAGVSQIASESDKVVLAMVFNSTGYPFEKAGYDGQKMTVSLLETTGQRTALGDFLMSQQVIFKEGLIGGVLSAAWPLRNISERGAKLSYAGLKKIDDRMMHELKYSPRKGSDLKISLFFDAETFQHVRSEYSHTVSARMGQRATSGPMAGLGSAPGSATSSDTGSNTINRYKLIEEFSDFKTTDSLTLPHTYKLRLTVDAQGARLLEWVMNFKQFAFNQPIEATAFNVGRTK